ncbi:MAG: hypothetical protein ACXWAT_09945 [Methylobacter sp.]
MSSATYLWLGLADRIIDRIAAGGGVVCLGSVVTLLFWWLKWVRIKPFGDLMYCAFTPLWWGFILALDGLAYRRVRVIAVVVSGIERGEFISVVGQSGGEKPLLSSGETSRFDRLQRSKE